MILFAEISGIDIAATGKDKSVERFFCAVAVGKVRLTARVLNGFGIIFAVGGLGNGN